MGMSVIPFSFSEEIPDWVKHTAQWWADRKISQSDFTNALESLIKDGIINIPPTEMAPPGPDKEIPDWVRNTAGWWADDYIPDSDFINAIQYLVSIGLIEVKVSTPEPVVEEIVEIKKSIPLMLLVEGYDTVTPEKKFVLDVLVFNAEKYPKASPKFDRNASYTVDGVNVEIELHNEEGQIHTFSGTTKDGFLRYEILARETSQDGTLWMINNLYTVNISVSLDGENTGKIHQFHGSANYDKGSATATATTTWQGRILKTVEINDSTANGPVLANGDRFGSFVANIGDLDGDGVNDLAVGAYDDDMDENGNSSGGTSRGALHIMYMNTNGSVKSTVEINDSTANGPTLQNNSDFGRGVVNIGDLDGDGVNDIAVGDAEGSGDGKGAVYIMYMNTNGSIDSTVKIDDSTANGPDLDDDDSFGTSIANMGDLNGDGVNDLAVGAKNDDAGPGSNKGTVHIMYMNTDGSVDSTVEINTTTANGPDLTNSHDRFGHAVANIGDLDGDGVEDIMASAMLSDCVDCTGQNAGSAHIMFMNTDGSVDSTVEIDDSTANGPVIVDADNFGTSIANMGDLDGDGVNDLAVGMWLDDGEGTNRGVIHIMYMNTDGSVKSTVEINDSNTNGPTLSNSDRFGSSVANIGDLDGNGINDLVVGAQEDDMDENGNSSGGNNRGALHIIFLE